MLTIHVQELAQLVNVPVIVLRMRIRRSWAPHVHVARELRVYEVISLCAAVC
jgi:hypothetical protein